MVVIAFISSILLALIVGMCIGNILTEKESETKKRTNLSQMTDEEIEAKYLL